MPIVDEDGKPQNVKYVPLDNATIKSRADKLNQLFQDFLNRLRSFYAQSLVIEAGEMDVTALEEVVVRVDKRKEHARIFHDIEDSVEYRVVALYCYWIIKLHPFNIVCTHTGEKSKGFLDSGINESFAVFLYTYVVKKVLNVNGQLLEDFIIELFYTFRYRDLNKASMVMLYEPRFVFPKHTYQSGPNT